MMKLVLWAKKMLPKPMRVWAKKMLPKPIISSITPPPPDRDLPSTEDLRNALREDHSVLFNGNNAIQAEYLHVENECPACGCRNFGLSFSKDFFNFAECNVCSHTFVNPRLNEKGLDYFYNEGTYTKLYNMPKFYEMPKASVEGARKDSIHLLGLATASLDQDAGKNLLEIGPGGSGILIAEALRLKLNVSCVEIDKACCANLRNLFGNKINIHNSSIEDIHQAYAESFDIIVMRDVLEHIPAPRNFLVLCQKMLRPGGVLITRMPNQRGLVYKIAGSRHVCVFGFEHLSYWTEHSMRTALHKADLEVDSLTTISNDLSLPELESLSADIGEFENRFTSAFDAEDNLDRPSKQLYSLYKRLWLACKSEALKSDLVDFIDKIGFGSELVVVAKKQKTTR